MADDVTLEDLQKVYKRLEVLEAATKELARLQKVGDEYDKDMNKIITDTGKDLRDDIKALKGRVDTLEKSSKKK